jgi:hypothetical protein
MYRTIRSASPSSSFRAPALRNVNDDGDAVAGGLPVMSDGARAADQNNPKGYFEYERVKTLDKDGDKSWLKGARGKAIKIISFLLPYPPDTIIIESSSCIEPWRKSSHPRTGC